MSVAKGKMSKARDVHRTDRSQEVFRVRGDVVPVHIKTVLAVQDIKALNHDLSTSENDVDIQSIDGAFSFPIGNRMYDVNSSAHRLCFRDFDQEICKNLYSDFCWQAQQRAARCHGV